MRTDFGYDRTSQQVHLFCFSASRFTGKERDGESGLDYFVAIYSSSMGRWMSLDWAAILAFPLRKAWRCSVSGSLAGVSSGTY